MAEPEQRGVLVTGGSGYVGTALRAHLAKTAPDVRVWAPARRELDLADDFREVEPPFEIGAVVHLAASRDRSDASAARYPEEIRIHVDATARLYTWAIEHGARAIVHVSTISVLEASTDTSVRIDEDAPIEMDAHPYVLTKRWGEELAEGFIDEVESMAIVRPGMIYGPNMPERSSLAKMIASLDRPGEPRPIPAPRGNVFAPVYVDDVVDVLARLAIDPKSTVVNVAGPDALFEIEMLRDLGVRFGKTPAYVVDRDAEPIALAPSTARVDALFPSRIKTSWQDGLARLT